MADIYELLGNLLKSGYGKAKESAPAIQEQVNQGLQQVSPILNPTMDVINSGLAMPSMGNPGAVLQNLIMKKVVNKLGEFYGNSAVEMAQVASPQETVQTIQKTLGAPEQFQQQQTPSQPADTTNVRDPFQPPAQVTNISPVSQNQQQGQNVLQSLLGSTKGFLSQWGQNALESEGVKNIDKEVELAKRKAIEVPPTQAELLSKDVELAKAQATSVQAFNKPMSPTEGKDFSALMEGRDAINEISEFLFSDPSKTSGLIVGNKFTPYFFKSDASKKFDSAIERALQIKTRAETGAAMQPSELKNAKKRYLPRLGDTVESVKGRLKPLGNYFERSISSADPTGVHQQRASSNEQVVQLTKALMQEAKRRGLKI